MRTSVFFPQADLLVQVLPFVHAEQCFALKAATPRGLHTIGNSQCLTNRGLLHWIIEQRHGNNQPLNFAGR